MGVQKRVELLEVHRALFFVQRRYSSSVQFKKYRVTIDLHEGFKGTIAQVRELGGILLVFCLLVEIYCILKVARVEVFLFVERLELWLNRNTLVRSNHPLKVIRYHASNFSSKSG